LKLLDKAYIRVVVESNPPENRTSAFLLSTTFIVPNNLMQLSLQSRFNIIT
jgi:hypothetical protein